VVEYNLSRDSFFSQFGFYKDHICRGEYLDASLDYYLSKADTVNWKNWDYPLLFLLWFLQLRKTPLNLAEKALACFCKSSDHILEIECVPWSGDFTGKSNKRRIFFDDGSAPEPEILNQLSGGTDSLLVTAKGLEYLDSKEGIPESVIIYLLGYSSFLKTFSRRRQVIHYHYWSNADEALNCLVRNASSPLSYFSYFINHSIESWKIEQLSFVYQSLLSKMSGELDFKRAPDVLVPGGIRGFVGGDSEHPLVQKYLHMAYPEIPQLLNYSQIFQWNSTPLFEVTESNWDSIYKECLSLGYEADDKLDTGKELTSTMEWVSWIVALKQRYPTLNMRISYVPSFSGAPG
jgi:hypothetical protein